MLRDNLHLVSIVGARPHFVKLGPIARAITEPTDITHRIIHTGQHYDHNLSQAFFDELDLPQADIHLGIGSGSHGVQTGEILRQLDRVFCRNRPDLVLTYGDTNSTIAGALAAAKLHIPVAHVEAGLRSGRKSMPEEINRVLTDHVSSILLCPTATSVANLKAEGLGTPANDGDLIPLDMQDFPSNVTEDAPLIVNVGDVMYDSVLHHAERAFSRGRTKVLRDLGSSRCALLTVHRADNTDDPKRLSEILNAASELANNDLHVVFPAHPRVRAAIEGTSLELLLRGVEMIEPVSYYDMLTMIREASIVLTDSGGVQREAFMLSTPCVTLREETEWVELLDTGISKLAGADCKRIVETARDLLKSTLTALQPSPYGDGKAAVRIIQACLAWWDHVSA